MLQVHKIILWAKAKDENFEDTVSKAYKTIQPLIEYGTEISPVYQTVSKKKDAKPFEWSFESFKELVKSSVNREGKNIFPDLGYTFSFFSSLNSKESAGISMSVGISNPKFKNTIIVNLPQSMNLYEDSLVAEKIVSVFKKCVNSFEPFWGCIVNEANTERFDGYFKDGLPITTHWVNYFDEELAQKVGKEKIINAPFFESERIRHGYFLRIDKSPINDEIAACVDIQTKFNNYLGLK